MRRLLASQMRSGLVGCSCTVGWKKFSLSFSFDIFQGAIRKVGVITSSADFLRLQRRGVILVAVTS